MEARELFQRIVAAWPAVLDISERQPTENGHWFPALAQANGKVEAAIDFSTEHWWSVAAWSFYQAVVRYADEMYQAGHRTVSPASVPLALFDERIRSNLQSPGFEEEAATYEPL